MASPRLLTRRRNHMENGRDRISDLPDDLLHSVLVCLQSAPAAARTSILSHRWRRVWAHLPELVFGLDGDGLDDHYEVDSALGAYSAPTVSILNITIRHRCLHYILADSVAAWLSFASQRVTGTFSFTVNTRCRCDWGLSTVAIDLPPCERATSIVLSLEKSRLRLRPAGPFTALTDLKIESTFMEARELEALVSSHCPHLRDLTVFTTLLFVGSGVSIRSSSLERLNVHLERTGRLEVAAPLLEVLTSSTMCEAVHISAPKLAVVDVSYLHNYQFAGTGRHLRQLKIDESTTVVGMGMRLFDTVDELTLQIHTSQCSMDGINILPKCEILRLSLSGYQHCFVPCLLQILRRANSIRKFVLDRYFFSMVGECGLACPCRLPESSNADKIILDSLEEIEVDHFFEGDERLGFLELLLSRCSAPKHTSLKITTPYKGHLADALSEEVVEKVRSICPPNVRLTIT